ncbi:MAG: UPF0104 family protein [Bacteroidetes bacterium]|nr:UPF0104 family protein [Bacteroidota bacterium]
MTLNKKTITNALIIVLTILIFLWIGLKTDWAATWNAVVSADLRWVGTSVLVMIFAHWLRGYRWNMLTAPAGFPLNTKRSFYAVMSGYLINVATSRGGEVVRCAVTSKTENAPTDLLIGTVVTERLVDMLMLMLVCVTGLLVEFQHIYGFFDSFILTPIGKAVTLPNILIILALLTLGILLIKYRKSKNSNTTPGKIATLLSGFSKGLKTIFALEKPALFFLYSAGIWFCYMLSGYCLLQSLPVTEHMEFGSAISLLIFSAVGIAIPLPAGAGVWGAISFGLQAVYAISAKDAETFGIFNLAYQNLFSIIIGGICYMLMMMEMRKIKTA